MTIISSEKINYYSPDFIVKKLDSCIDLIKQNIRCYCNDPIKDFTRNRKWTFEAICKFLIQMEIKGLKSEICNYFESNDSLATDSALLQQRMKLLPEALENILFYFTRSFKHYKTINGYYLLACDGSDINIPFDASDKDTLCQTSDNKPYNQFHLNVLYDCLNHIYWDVNIDTATKKREQDALKELIMRHYHPMKSIITCDRGYEGYDLIACCKEEGQKFVIRVKDKDKATGILKNITLPEGDVDINVRKIMSRKQTKEVKSNKELYTVITNTVKFTYLDITEDFYELNFRVVGFQLENGKVEYLITNLECDEFSLEDLKELYHYRWEVETSFRKLKYTVGLTGFHSKKRNLIKQEIFARLILYNLSEIIANNVSIRKKGKKHIMNFNFTLAVTNIRLFLRNKISADILTERIKKYLVPIRPDRSSARNVKPQSAMSFNNRCA